MRNNNNIAKMKNSGELLIETQGNVVSDRSRLLIEQMKGKLNQCERKAIQRINELDLVLSQEGLQDRAQNEINLWQQRYKIKQELKVESFSSKMLRKLRRWSI